MEGARRVRGLIGEEMGDCERIKRKQGSKRLVVMMVDLISGLFLVVVSGRGFSLGSATFCVACSLWCAVPALHGEHYSDRLRLL